jgi:hypothetical protein
MFVLHGKGKMLHMARNIFPVHKVVIEVKLRNFSVELMKITPFNGSNFFNGSKPFLGGTRYEYKDSGVRVPVWEVRQNQVYSRSFYMQLIQGRGEWPDLPLEPGIIAGRVRKVRKNWVTKFYDKISAP